MRVLVAYVTRYGHARDVALAIVRELRACGLEAETGDLETQWRSPDHYDAVILGTSETFGHFPAALVAWIVEHRARLAAIPTAMFALRWRTGSVPRHFAHFIARTRWTPGECITFGGRVAYRRYSTPTRILLLAGNALVGMRGALLDPSANHVLTDWAAVAAFARRFANRARPASPAPARATVARIAPGPA
jgi:menaquinone-dependent protoporphyrinogen oxidase